MARFDDGELQLVLRIVYDGAAMAGKTTTLKALAAILGRPVYSSASPTGRTLHFDWMEHHGGRVGELSVSCQVLTVPGQDELARRRRAILASADAIVFVVGSRPAELDGGLHSLGSLRDLLATRPEPRPGVVLQANKRDLPEAVGVDAIRQRLAISGAVGVVESSATHGQGVLQPFLLAVRLALDRAHALAQSGTLVAGEPTAAAASAAELLATLEALAGEPSPSPPLSTSTPPGARSSDRPVRGTPAGRSKPSIPGPELPPGRVWPPVEGRIVLHEISTAASPTLGRGHGHDWRGSAGPWVLHAPAAGVYADEEEATSALMSWARWHAGLGQYLSRRRSIALVEERAAGDRPTTYRLWQVVLREPTLRQRVVGTIQAGNPDDAAAVLLEGARALATVHATIARTGLRVSPDTVGLLDQGPAYVGWAPTPRGLERRPADFVPAPLDLERTIGELVASHEALANRRDAVASRLGALGSTSEERRLASRLAAVVASAPAETG